MLAQTASKGGNLLLSVGPDGEGRIPEASVKRLRQVGQWLEVNGESIYGTRSATLGQLPWGLVTRKSETLYLHVLHAPENRELFVPNVEQVSGNASLLATGEILQWQKVDGGMVIQLPDVLPDRRNTVVVLPTSGVDFDSLESDAMTYFVDRQSGSIELSPHLAELAGGAEQKSLRYWLYFGQWKYYPTIVGMEKPADVAKWSLRVIEPGEYRVSLVYAADDTEVGQEGRIIFDGLSGEQSLLFRVLETAPMSTGKPVLTVTHELGIMDFERGVADLSIAPLREGVNLFKIERIVMTPVD